MADLQNFNNLVRRFSDDADFVVVYIAEAHAADGWAFETNFKIMAHKNMEERFSAAKFFISQGQPVCPVVVDSMTNSALIQYGAAPERLYIIQDGVVVYKGGMGPVLL